MGENALRIYPEREGYELQSKARYFDAIIDNVPEGLALVDAESRIIRSVSRYAALYAGRSRTELEGIPLDEVVERWHLFKSDGVSKPENEEFIIFRTIDQKACFENEEWVFMKPNGARVTVLMNSCPILDGNGDVSEVALSWIDISEHKATEERIRNLNLELNEALRRVKVLSGMLNVCAVCKRIQDDRGNWQSLEKYIEQRSEAVFSQAYARTALKGFTAARIKARKNRENKSHHSPLARTFYRNRTTL
ncbi:MAG: PAS domain-containing protein [Deltaproteobacteria bacterium]|nr:PAS domain-containing protein [Deltaproteobacteria bacterium]MBZ0219908.1 PAS domain-containing protein [Deltaproteobacteria bacterium]